MMLAFLSLVLWLLVIHALADFPLQGDFLAEGKNRHGRLFRTVPWWYVMAAHAAIHAGGVAYVTGSIMLGMLEFCIHWSIDFAKCEGWMGAEPKRAFLIDQALHIACKLAWAAVMVLGAV